MTYNLENYGGIFYSDYQTKMKDESARHESFRLVIGETDPDILIAQEIWGCYDGNTDFLDNVLNFSENIYAEAFIDQKTDWNDDVSHDIGVYYKNQMFQPLSQKTVDIAGGYLRDALEVKLKHNATGDTIFLYGVHLKAGNDDQEERQKEAKKLRDYLNRHKAHTAFIIAGDFNLYSSSEGAWARLTENQADNDGIVYDPIDRIGAWQKNYSFRDVHTQSTRYSSGGLDDRFDFLLISAGIKAHHKIEYAPGTYTAFGNDGDHFDDSVNWQTNNVVSASIADALVNNSDHLPVFADFNFSVKTELKRELSVAGFELYQNFPNPFNPNTTISFEIPRSAMIQLTVYDIRGKVIKILACRKFSTGKHYLVWDGTDNQGRRVTNGLYFYQVESDNGFKFSKKMVLVK
jgi:endonuclease/exonuclease/phosphatase family metal-dependent hydrolase